ncbi:Uncharacterized protein QTN25_000505 [Entamoeba marina]
MSLTVNIINYGTINMSGFPPLQSTDTPLTTTSQTQSPSLSILLGAPQPSQIPSSTEIEQTKPIKRVPEWGNLMLQIKESGERRSKKHAHQAMRKMKPELMEEIKKTKGSSHKKKRKTDKKPTEFVPTSILSWTPYTKHQVVWDANQDGYDRFHLLNFNVHPSMMILYFTDVAIFGTYHVNPPLMINNKVVFNECYTIFVVDTLKGIEKRLKITNNSVASTGDDIVISSGNHIITEMSEGLAIYLKRLPLYHNADIFYQNNYHYIKNIVAVSFYD